MNGPQPGHGAVPVDGERWREAAQLRHDHAGCPVPAATQPCPPRPLPTWPPRSSRPSGPPALALREGARGDRRYRNPPGASPEQITLVIVRALAAIAAAQRA